MTSITSHLILVSAQAIPNITPVLDEGFKPRHVILLLSPDMTQQAEWLEQVFHRRHIKTSRWSIDDAWDIEHIRDRVLALMVEYPEGALALNATGGTKPMSIAAYEAFRTLEQPIFYVHPHHDRVIWLYPKNHPDQDLADHIKLPEFLQAYGANVVEQGDKLGVPLAQRTLTGQLIARMTYYAKPLSTLNWLAAQAEQNHLTATLTKPLSPALSDLLGLFADHQLFIQHHNRIVFPNEAARFYVNGGWLEQHVYGICLNLKMQFGLQDIGRSIEVERIYRNTSVKNEIDVAFLKDNRLYLIECKTKVFSNRHPVHSEGAQALYKLDSLKDLLGGLQARAMLVSFTKPTEYDLQRAGDLGIRVCCHQNLTRLTEHLQEWIK